MSTLCMLNQSEPLAKKIAALGMRVLAGMITSNDFGFITLS